MRSPPRIHVALALAPWVLGCSAFQPDKQAISITTNEPESVIYVDNVEVGRGSAIASVRRNTSHSIVARLEDRAISTQTTTKFSQTGWLDVAGGFLLLLPWFGLLTPGCYEQELVYITLTIPPGP
jgi:hypothetical protein